MAGIDHLHAMTCFTFLLLLTVVHGQGRSKEQYSSAGGGEQEQETRRGSSSPSSASPEEEEFVPVQKSVVYRSSVSSDPPDTCHECRCCSTANKSNCVQTQCCYSIKCHFYPDKPYGVCVGTPLRCGCDPNNTCGATLALNR